MNYIGIKCPVCHRPFEAGDDIVVCPICGAPYHRHCYEQAGKCLFEEKHAAGEAWSPDAAEDSAEKKSGQMKQCPFCGKMNAPNALFCDRCGHPLTFSGPAPGPAPSWGQNGAPQNGFPLPGMQNPAMLDPLSGIGADEPLHDGVTAGDLSKLVQNNSAYYLPVFMRISHVNQSRFNFAAFLFSGGWMLYRKLYKIGAVLTCLMAALFFGNTFVSLNYSTPILLSLYEKVGASTDVYPSYSQLIQMSELLYRMDPLSVFLFFLPIVFMALEFAIMLFCGIRGTRIYYENCVKTVQEIRAEAQTPAQGDQMLQERGGVNVSLAVCLLICYSLLVYLPNLFL